MYYVIAEYQPGTPGAEWTDEEVGIVRQKVLKFLSHEKDEIQEMFQGMTNTGKYEAFSVFGLNRPITEMALFRLAFHDCLTYKDGTGGCDGCLNWDKMGTDAPSPFKGPMFPSTGIAQDTYCQHQFEKVNKTDNNGLDRLVFYLEKMYSSTDFPPGAPNLDASLKSSGKSRADLWQFAANVALERTIERSNFGCRHDFFQRQQVPLLEGVNAGKGFAYGVWKCKIKLNKPFKFQFGRKDCIPTYMDQPYKTEKEENHANPHANADVIVSGLKHHLGMSARDLTALTSIHGMINPFGFGSIGSKYQWLGSSAYLSNIYYKMLSNRPTYDVLGAAGFDMKSNQKHNLLPYSVGDENGRPVAMWSMRVSCEDCWNTTQTWAGGPCTWRATGSHNPDNPFKKPVRNPKFSGFDENGIRKGNSQVCFTSEGIQVGNSGQRFNDRGATGAWSNMFMLNYEGGLYKKFDIDPVANRATGCEGINLDPEKPDEMWDHSFNAGCPKATGCNSHVKSGVNQCEKQDLIVEDGQVLSKIVEEFADDHDVWASDFLDAWPRMQSIGYTDLKDAPENSWLGYYTLKDMGAKIGMIFLQYSNGMSHKNLDLLPN